jgi:rod shape determining protein RodA
MVRNPHARSRFNFRKLRSRKHILQDLDWVTVLIYLAMVFFGWVNIYAAIYNPEYHSMLDVSQNYGKQMIWIGSSLLLAMLILIIDSKFYSVFSFVIYFLMLAMLVVVLFFGREIAGSKSWLHFGSFALQPAEFMKMATALALSKYLSDMNIDLGRFTSLLKASVIVLIPVLLIELQNDTGTALVFLSFAFVFYRQGMSGAILMTGAGILMLFFLTLLVNNMILIGILAMVAFLIILLMQRTARNIVAVIMLFLMASGFVVSVDYAFNNVLKPHQQMRVNVLIGKDTDLLGAGYNVHQSLIAIGSGGFSGKGFLQGTQTKYNFVPEQSTDFIFCTVGEEWGFIGASIVVLLFTFLLIRLIILAERQRSDFSRIYGYSVFSIIFFHFAINVAMTLGLFPVIGIPLPFFSYGGSSLWGFTALLFIFLKLDSDRKNVL